MKKIEESVYMLKYLEERKERCAIYEEEKYNADHIIKDYETGYQRLVTEILVNLAVSAKIKASIAEIVSNYAWTFELNHKDLFWKLRENPRWQSCAF